MLIETRIDLNKGWLNSSNCYCVLDIYGIVTKLAKYATSLIMITFVGQVKFHEHFIITKQHFKFEINTIEME